MEKQCFYRLFLKYPVEKYRKEHNGHNVVFFVFLSCLLFSKTIRKIKIIEYSRSLQLQSLKFIQKVVYI